MMLMIEAREIEEDTERWRWSAYGHEPGEVLLILHHFVRLELMI